MLLRAATILRSLPSRVNQTPRVFLCRSRAASDGRELPERSARLSEAAGALYRKLLETPAVERKEHVSVATPSLEGHSQSFGRVLTIIAPDMALLERDGKLLLLALPVAERWLKQAQLTPGKCGLCAAVIDPGSPENIR